MYVRHRSFHHHLLLTPLTHWTKLLCELRSNGIKDASVRRGTNQLLASPRLRSIISSSTKENGRAPWCRSLTVDERERKGFQGIAVRLPIQQDVPVVPCLLLLLKLAVCTLLFPLPYALRVRVVRAATFQPVLLIALRLAAVFCAFACIAKVSRVFLLLSLLGQTYSSRRSIRNLPRTRNNSTKLPSYNIILVSNSSAFSYPDPLTRKPNIRDPSSVVLAAWEEVPADSPSVHRISMFSSIRQSPEHTCC